MHNDFIILGPPADPAKIQGNKDIAKVLTQIAESKSTFVSRADESGTHQKELSLWKAANVEPSGECYLKAGTGMAAALRIAHEKKAYILADRATFLKLRKELELTIVSEGDEQLLNRYSVITINPEKYPRLQHAEAERFGAFLISDIGQKLIGEFGLQEFGQPLFVPDFRSE